MLAMLSKRTLAWSVAIASALGLAATSITPTSEAAIPGATATLDLRVTFEGEGTVDDEHRIWIFLWSEPELGGMPLAMESLSENGDLLTISGLPESAVYITCVYDAHGGYHPMRAMGPPPADSPRGAYLGDPPGSSLAPVSLKSGETASVELRFGGDARRADQSGGGPTRP